MKKRIIIALLFGLIGAGVLVGLGLWQLERMQWKTKMLAQIEARIGSEPVAIPVDPISTRDQYLPVKVSGTILEDEIHVLASVQKIGAGYRIISAFEVDGGRRVMLDRGFVAIAAKDAERPEVAAEIIGNLQWPDEINSATPEPDLAAAIWFARDIVAMAEVLGTEPVLVVQRGSSEAALVTSPFPVSSSGIPNRHLEYVVTWFGLALVWLGMTAYLIWRIRRERTAKAK
ncbi:MAG: SURF1 family protein [Marinosulfonomonas sp.]|nr:SURF1 family protein [Marinosulfonomonas sp.]